jgi:hypothetical protein
VLQGYGTTVELHGETFISTAGITSTTFSTIPDVPVGTFDLTLPQGPNSALAANGNLCASRLVMPTEFTAQDGALIRQNTQIGVGGCKKAIRIVGHKVKGKKATITVNVPSAGKLLATGAGVTSAAQTARQAGNVTLTLGISKKEQRLLKHHGRRKLRVAVKLVFKSADGSKLSSSLALVLSG